MEKIIKYIRYLDYLGAIASLAWGLSQHSLLWIGFGCVGLLFAWWSPAKRLSGFAQKRFLGRNKVRQAASRAAIESVQVSSPQSSAEKVPFYGYRTDVPYPRGVRVLRLKGVDSYLPYALFICERFGKKRS